jgi:hypothetical protein
LKGKAVSQPQELLPLIRKKVGSFLYPYGSFPDDDYEQVEGYESDYFTPPDEEGSGERYRTVIMVSAEKLVPLFLDLCALLPQRVHVVMERASEDIYTERDVFVGETEVTREQFIEVFKAYEFTFAEDGMLGIGAFGQERPYELFLADHKELVLFAPELSAVTSVLQKHNLQARKLEFFYERSHTHLSLTQYRGLRGSQFDYLHVADTLRHVFGMSLQHDEDQNLDDAGRPLGLVPWRAIVVVTPSRRGRLPRRRSRSFVQEFFLNARTRREARELLQEHLGQSGFEVQSLDELFRIDVQELPREIRPESSRLQEPGIWYAGERTETDVHWH